MMSPSASSAAHQSMNMTPTSSAMPGGVTLEALEVAARTVEKMLHADSQFPSLAEKLRVGGHPTVSGMQELDYPIPMTGDLGASLKHMSVMKKVSLPTELVEHFGHMQCNCMMGLFPEIERAWLTIDSDIYVWRFEDKSDLAYFDGLSDTILSVALLEPKKDIFQPYIKHLLCLTTAVEIVLLGVSFGSVEGDEIGEMHLLPEPLFSLPTDSTFIISVAGSSKSGRIFLGGKDGNLYEFAYKADNGWFGKRATKINHSTSALSFLVPNFINAALYEEDAIEQIIVDDSRNILFTRSEKGEIQVFDLGHDGLQMTCVVALSQTVIVQEASRIAANVDKSNFAPIIGISSLPLSDSAQLSLVAVSSNGVRYYFSTSAPSLATDTGRPQGLVLQHIRLPPGFSATSQVPKPSNIHMSYYKQGSLLLKSSQNDDSDAVWLLSCDSFDFHNILMENQCIIPVDGKIWAMDEIPQSQNLMRLYKESFGSQDPPLAVIQQSQTPRKFVLISSQGTHILSKLRPVDHLRQLLIDSSGPDSDVIKAYFGSHLDIQAAANCLLLACSQSLQDSQVSQWATRAFFLYGGKPQLVFPHQTQVQVQNHLGYPSPMPQTAPFSSSSFHPHLAATPGTNPNVPMSPFSPPLDSLQGISTPTSGMQSMMSGPAIPEMHFSAKHNALYLYFSRLIRPVWSATVVVPGNKDSPMNSTVSGNEIEWIITQLRDLKCFLEKNSQFAANITKNQFNSGGGFEPGSRNLSSIQQKSVQEALLRERQSLMFLQHLVVHSLQVMGLWKVIYDHQFHVIASSLSLDDQNILRGMYFRDLIISATGRDLCNRLVQSIVQQYLNDNASTDAISNRLREVCPNLYHNEDVISSKAHELLISARNLTDVRRRNNLLKEAVNMCKEVAAHVNLDVLTNHLTAVHCYDGTIELCLAAANKRDPQGLALHFYKNGEPVEDKQGMQAFITRMSCYNNILEIIRKLVDTSQAHQMSPNVPSNPEPSTASDSAFLAPSEAAEHLENVLQVALNSDDNIFHVALYQWLIDQRQFDRLLGIRTQFLEDFLTRGTKKLPDSVVMFDLLWKFYEKTRSYAAAAKILSKLADRPCKEINLSQRLEYLSRAIMCVKSGELGGESSRVQAGELLHDLEEKMEVARVQLQIVDTLTNMQQIRSGDVGQALSRLNSELLDISSLYQIYAEPFELWECQLAILHCSGHNDPPLVQNMWTNIIEEELRKSEGKAMQTRFQLLSNKIKYLGKLYAFSQKYFPLEFIVRNLEIFSCGGTDDHTVTVSSQANKDYSWVFKTILDIGISMPKILDVYNRLYMANDNIWLNRGSQNHLLHVLAKILETFADSPTIVNYNERRQFSVLCLDAVGQYLGNLYTKHDSQLLVKEFKGIQAKLERL